MNATKSIFTCVLTAAFLVACGGGSDSTIYKPDRSNPLSEVINGIPVPKRPGPLMDATVEGIDTDGNGIRDEVDRAIAERFGIDAHKYAVAQYLAKIDQKLLVTDASDRTKAQKAAFEVADSGVCLSRLFRSDIRNGIELMHYVESLSYNTKPRRAQYAEIVSATGSFVRSVGDAVCP